MSRVVQDLLLLARSDSGQLDLELEPASISDILEYTLDAPRGRDGPAIRMDDLDEACRVDGDEHYLIRLFVNLLDNALRHTPPDGDIAVSARRVGSSLKVSIRDTGEGISPDHLPHLGERFYRVDTARQRTLGGTGLGLAICKSIVQAHGGVLEFQSTLGKGTTVTVTLPAAFEPIVHS